MSTVSALQPGDTFHERYRVVRSLSAGGMGAVYEVVDERTNSPRALKVMLPSLVADPDLRARFTLDEDVYRQHYQKLTAKKAAKAEKAA